MESVNNSTAVIPHLAPAAQGLLGGKVDLGLTMKIFVAFFTGLANYNVIEIIVMIFGTFTRFSGLYFWSLLISSLGIIPYSIGFLLKYFDILLGPSSWASVVILTIGWYPMVTGQAVILWSRLHLIVQGEKGARILRWTKWMIVINFIILHLPTTVLTMGSNVNPPNSSTYIFAKGYNVMEKIQMVGFFVQEVILSSIYIGETIRILRTSIQAGTRHMMYQLLGINVLIIIMDLAMVVLEGASLYILETTIKSVFYSIKIKLEFAILNKLVHFVGRPQDEAHQRHRQSTTFIMDETDSKESRNDSRHRNNRSEKSRTRKSSSAAATSTTAGGGNGGPDRDDISDFVDLTKVQSDVTNPAAAADALRRTTPGRTRSSSRPDWEWDLARLEHVETVKSNYSHANGTLQEP